MVTIPVADGDVVLEGIYMAEEDDDASGAVIAPPHPQMGGSMDSPVVNEVARLERLSKQLDKPVLASASFAGLTRDELVSVGSHQLRGTRAAQEVFTLPECV